MRKFEAMKKLISFLIFLTLMMLSIFSFDAEAQQLKRRGVVIIKPKAQRLNTRWVEGRWVWNRRIQRHIWIEGHWAVRKTPYASRMIRRSNRWYY